MEREAPHISASQVGFFLDCPKKYQLSYVDKLVPEGEPDWKFVGSEFHKCRAKIDDGLEWEIAPIPPDSLATEYDVEKLRAVLTWYSENFRSYIFGTGKSEVSFKFSTPAGNNVIGQVDRLVTLDSGETALIEWKYAASDYNALIERRQASVYFHAFPDATRFILLIAKKPAIKVKKNESPSEFFDRSYQYVCDSVSSDSAIVRSEFMRHEFAIQDEIRAIDTVVEMIDKCRERASFPMLCSPVACPRCDWRKVCKGL